jgi:hypothetical protein
VWLCRQGEGSPTVGPDASTVGSFGLGPPPPGLMLVQDLINTALRGHHGQPVTISRTCRQPRPGWGMVAWSAATGKRAPEISLQQRDLDPLRTLREQLRQSLRANAAHVDPVQHTGLDGAVTSGVRLTLRANGQVGHQPLATGWEGVAGLIAIEMLVAGATGSLSRLKTCAAPVRILLPRRITEPRSSGTTLSCAGTCPTCVPPVLGGRPSTPTSEPPDRPINCRRRAGLRSLAPLVRHRLVACAGRRLVVSAR